MTNSTFKGRTVLQDKTAANAAPAADAAKAKTTRGNGPLKVRFKNSAGEVSDKAVDVAAIVIEHREGETVKATQDYPLSAYNDEALNTFAALGVARILETYMRNHAELDGRDGIDLATKRNGELIEGKLYVRSARGEGGSGKSADVSIYVEAYKIACKLRKMNITDEQVEGFKTKLEGFKGKDRLAAIGKLNKDMIFKKAILQAKLEAMKLEAPKAGKSGKDEVNYADLF